MSNLDINTLLYYKYRIKMMQDGKINRY